MNKYESVIIINSTVEEEGTKTLIQKFTDIINNDGKLEKVEELGKKKLAYEVKKCKEGYYAIFHFEGNTTLISELERNYRITDEVIKFMTIKID
ncbi:MAG TPA: 30S ribosomal protein S6 [Clostridia bacterium]|jgi:small subunit ribosomal protein S6|nr:30S ribosomal protein S6 [Clostridia bacterium]